MIDAIGVGRSIALSAYTLHAGSDIVSALEHAAQNGAEVHVRLGKAVSDSHGDIDQKNAAVIDELTRHRVIVTQTDSLEHLKAAVVDGKAYFDDRNWTANGSETVIVDSRRADVKAVKAALRDGDASFHSRDLALGKVGATRLEQDLISSTKRSTLEVQTETVTTASAVEDELLLAARRHERVRLIVSDDGRKDPGERAALRQLARNGVEIRIGDGYSGTGNEKFCVAGERAWLGSANASWAGKGHGSLDWGLRTNSRAIADALHHQFRDHWNDSVRYVA